MSVVPFTTQIGPNAGTQGSQVFARIVFVYTDKITERQSSLMKESQGYLCQNLTIVIIKADELDSLSPQTKYFVIPSLKDDAFKKIKARFEKPIIYLPRAVIEARGYYRVNLPARNVAVSLTMHNCRVFLVKTCDLNIIRNKIFEMCGTIVTSFNNGDPNVVITDRADNRYCSKAFKRKIAVVSRDWVDDNYNCATEEESSYFNQDATTTFREHHIKPFYGLHFKLKAKNLGTDIKNLITSNGGRIIYGNETCLTHIVGSPEHDADSSDNADSGNNKKPKVVDVDFLNLCVKSGYHITGREYREILAARVVVKQERRSPTPVDKVENSTPPSSNGYDQSRENHTMLPPSIPRPFRQQSDNVNDMILRAISGFETAQTQLASTQMRRLPDPELQIERTMEPSQQLFWNESVSRRN